MKPFSSLSTTLRHRSGAERGVAVAAKAAVKGIGGGAHVHATPAGACPGARGGAWSRGDVVGAADTSGGGGGGLEHPHPCVLLQHAVIHGLLVGDLQLSLGAGQVLGMVTGVLELLCPPPIKPASLQGLLNGSPAAQLRVKQPPSRVLELQEPVACLVW